MGKKQLWIFGYGSLMWNPGFAHEQSQIARLSGYTRSFCMRSIHHRGTVADPGLVLALDAQPDAHCDGLGFCVSPDAHEQTLSYLRERELISSAYLEKTLPITLADGQRVAAVTFVVDDQHEQYCGGLALSEQAGIIAGATGGRGPNDEYLFNTTDHLGTLKINDPELEWLSCRVREITAQPAE